MNPEGSAHTIFNNALELSDPLERERYLKEACADDQELYELMGKLLQAHTEAGSFFAGPLKPAASEPALGPPGIERAGDSIGRYKLLEEIGAGGCGVVYMAEQQEPVRRRVALKVIKLGMDTRQVVGRFEAERQALALMDHPGIAKVLDAGATASGRPYFVMELVRGVRITEFCDRKRLPTRERLELFIHVCHAVQHAHQKGIIHRDLKPSNILITIVDGKPVPKVIDFGIAKATNNQPLTDKTLFTAFEQFIGTPAYMSPEQAEMSGVDIDTRTDIYSLGVVLYELLTGKTPFDAEALVRTGIDGLRRTIREQQPRRPSTRLRVLPQSDLCTTAQARRTEAPQLIHQLSGDLDWIVMKCLEKDRTRRYATATGLADDIRRHLDCHPVEARPPSRLYEFQKTVRRHKVGFAAAGAVILALSIGLVMSLWTLAKERQSRHRAIAAEQESQRQLYSALHGEARATIRSGELGQRVRALEAIRRASAISNSVELRSQAFAALALPDLRFERDLPRAREVTLAQFDPAFERLAIGRGAGPVEIRAVLDNELLASLPASTNLEAHVGMWSPDGRFLAVKRDEDTTGYRATLEVWKVGAAGTRAQGAAPAAFTEGAAGAARETALEAASEPAPATRPTGPLRYEPQSVLLLHGLRWDAVSFHPHLPRIIAGEGRFITIRDLTRGREVARFKMRDEAVDLEFSPEGERFAALYRSGDLAALGVHDAKTGEVLVSQRFSAGGGRGAVAWHPQGRWIATVDETGAACLTDPRTGELRTLGQHKSQAVSAVFSPDGDYLFTGSWDRELICWDLERMRAAFTVALDGFYLQFNRKGDRCAVFRQNGAILLHTFERPIPREFPGELGTRLWFAAFSPDGRWVAAAGMKGGGVWDLTEPSSAAVDKEAGEARFCFAPDGDEVFGSRNVRDDPRAFRWRLPAGNQPGTGPELKRLALRAPEEFSFMTWFSNSLVVTGAKGSQLLTRGEFETGSEQWARTASGISGVSPDGRWLAIYPPFTQWLWIYRMPGLESVTRLKQTAYINDFQFSPAADEVAVSSRFGVEFWSTSTWKRTHVLTNFTRLLYTPDPRACWLTRDSLTAGLYDRHTLEPLLLLPSGMLPLALSPDGRHLAVSVDGRKLQVWDLPAVRQQLQTMGLDWHQRVAVAKSAN